MALKLQRPGNHQKWLTRARQGRDVGRMLMVRSKRRRGIATAPYDHFSVFNRARDIPLKIVKGGKTS